MPEKDPTTYPLITYAWVLLLSSWGGVVAISGHMGTRAIFHLEQFAESRFGITGGGER